MNSSINKNSSSYLDYISRQQTYCRVSNIAELKEWIVTNHCYRDPRIMMNAKIQHTASIEALKHFESECKKATHYFPEAFSSRVKVIDLTFDVFQYFMNFIEDQVNLIQINLADDKDFMASWNAFRWDIAYLRYQTDPLLIERVNEFIDYLREQSHKIDQFKEPTLKEKQLWNVWEKILSCPDLLDVGLATLFDKTKTLEGEDLEIICLFTPIPIKVIQSAFSRQMDMISRDIFPVCSAVEQLIQSNYQFPFHPYFNPTESLLNLIAQIRETVIPHLPFIDLKNIKNSKLTIEHAIKLFNIIKKIGGANKWGESGFGDLSRHICMCKRILNFIENENQQIKLGENHIYDIDSYFDKSLNGIVISKGEEFKLGSMTLLEFKNFIQTLEVQQKCHILINTYVYKPFVRALHTSNGIYTWHQMCSEKKFDQVILTIQKQNLLLLNINASNLNDGSQKWVEDTRDVNELLAFINSGNTHKKSSKKNKIRQPRISQQLQSNAHIKNDQLRDEKQAFEKKQKKIISTPSHSLPINPSQLTSHQTPVNPLSIHQQRAANVAIKIKMLIAKYQFSDFQPLCGPLAQSFMHLNDLTVLYKGMLSQKSDGSQPAFSAVHVIASAYYHMEQLIRYQRMLSRIPYDSTFLCHEHNLKMLLKPLSESLTVDTTFPKLLYLANFWSFHTCEQLAGWSKLETTSDQTTPEPLKMIATAFEKSSSVEFIPALKKYVESTLLFSDSLLESDPSDIVAQKKVATANALFTHDQKFSVEMIVYTLDQCHLFIKILESDNRHPAILKLKQASQDLIILQEILKLLNKQRIEADFFSQLVRGAVYWQNGVMENLLGAIEYLKTGIDVRDHNLAEMYRRIWCKDENMKKKEDFAQEADYLESHWGLVNNFCRYPFEYQKFYSPTHELIIQAEALRTHPEFGQGFKMQSEKSVVYPTLNFFSVQSDQLNAKQLLEKLKALLSSSQTLIHNRFIPELKITLEFYSIK